MSLHPDASRAKPDRVTGIAHIFAATGYSIGGIRRLWQETAFRHIVLGLPVCTGVLALAGARVPDYCVLVILFFGLVATEALNTAIECIVDHLAPHWAEFARDAKDLGSLATMCMLAANGVFVGHVVWRAISA
ncbi:diacylglycerol kinase [Sulfitobacter guttiformis]|uniref:Diacylglycerol kinase n=1 Tax=Sulfitobacter guttiformis TaxID=74349 RepID=A0A420DJF9_9RHOB|nr:diacylglycerol kinase [Sulfitobacter guttiformis]KIN71811.1 Diacylglycerol kinase [Sulfitobacter guttiformis KCTC 32187]RKE94373.1 diacylglycerol kinase [Sulfitobacter guttiformis]